MVVAVGQQSGPSRSATSIRLTDSEKGCRCCRGWTGRGRRARFGHRFGHTMYNIRNRYGESHQLTAFSICAAKGFQRRGAQQRNGFATQHSRAKFSPALHHRQQDSKPLSPCFYASRHFWLSPQQSHTNTPAFSRSFLGIDVEKTPAQSAPGGLVAWLKDTRSSVKFTTVCAHAHTRRKVGAVAERRHGV